jgi:hypothetical protein
MPQKHIPPLQQPGGHGAFRDQSMSRLDRIEATIESIQQSLDVQFNRIAAMQAEIELLRAKRRSS